ncbi:double-stranded RNA-binding Staufen -like protein [Brachionus plicatilis]|uniref:Double-stranded RNA-binding Staufen-like protein n=1 Tax=Brachionus plicatilis TaxID=10195 RepID=A0A3M7RIW8_BRAPC|nr:double-stranded RNA-binding Staufen -like protein [Brachionus plicatilis]
MELKAESAPGPNSLVANLNELSSMNDFNKDFKNKPALRAGNKTPFFYPNPPAHIPFFPNQQSPNYQFFNPYQMSAKNFYSLSMFSKPTYQDRRSYLKVKKEQNMHKLWPHSVHTKPETSDEEPEFSKNYPWFLHFSIKFLGFEIIFCLKNVTMEYYMMSGGYKIKHEYILLDEKGPAHKKTFYVQLKLGAGTSEEESYEANGSSIKKAQHKAAEMALNETKYAKPSPRVKPEPGSRKIMFTVKKDNEPKQEQSNTVRLNSLCMKHGLKANYEHIATPVSHSIYTNFNSPNIKPFVYQPAQVYAPNFGFNRAFSFGKKSSRAQRYNRFGGDGISKVKLKIGNEEFVAEGESVQKARHSAAALALDFMSNEENFKKIKDYFNKQIEVGQISENNEQNKVYLFVFCTELELLQNKIEIK